MPLFKKKHIVPLAIYGVRCKPNSDKIAIAWMENVGVDLDNARFAVWDGSSDSWSTTPKTLDNTAQIGGWEPINIAWFDNGTGYCPMIVYNDSSSEGPDYINWAISLDDGANYTVQGDCNNEMSGLISDAYYINLYVDQNYKLYLTLQDSDTNPSPNTQNPTPEK